MKAPKFSEELHEAHVALVGQAGQKVQQVMKKCKVSEQTVYNWINGYTVPKPKQQLVVSRIYGLEIEPVMGE